MRRTDNGEVAAVGCSDLGHTQALGRGNDGSIDGSEREIPVTAYELGYTKRVCCVNRFHAEQAGREVSEEADFRLPAEASADQVDELCDHECWDDQRPGVRFQ